jgi:hypothetical protein
MALRPDRRWDPILAVATAVALVVLVAYLALMRRQGGGVAIWFVAVLAGAVVVGAYGTTGLRSGRRPLLLVSGVTLVVAGVLAILSVGLPVLCAGVLMLVAAARPRRP